MLACIYLKTCSTSSNWYFNTGKNVFLMKSHTKHKIDLKTLPQLARNIDSSSAVIPTLVINIFFKHFRTECSLRPNNPWRSICCDFISSPWQTACATVQIHNTQEVMNLIHKVWTIYLHFCLFLGGTVKLVATSLQMPAVYRHSGHSFYLPWDRNMP